MKRNLLNDPKFKTVVSLYERACKASREHSALAEQACKTYGDHGPQISGCVRDHFPETVKDQLRNLAHDVTNFCDAAAQARPARTRKETVYRIGRLVAKRDGSGFYGPRAGD